MTPRRSLWLTSSVLACLVLVPTSPVAAQRLGAGLDDPSGRTPVQPHDRPLGEAAVPAPPAYDGGPSAAPATSGIGVGHLASRLRALDATWATLGAQGTSYANGVISLVLGAAEVVVGGVLLEVGGGWELMAPFFFVTGGVAIVRTILIDFVLRPNPQAIAIEYAMMPSGSHAQQLARLRYGESQLRSIAEQSAILRYVDSGINVLGAGALIGAYLAIRDDTVDFNPIELIFFIGPAVSTLVAVINLFSPSNAERRWDAYREMRDRQGGDLSSIELAPIFAVDPDGGGLAGLSGRF